jgi:steroid delta-isomerase-like uncharacterized protein
MFGREKALVRRAFEAYNAHDVEALERMTSTSFIYHARQGDINIQGWKDMTTKMFAAFPDLRMTIDDILSEGSKVAARYTFKGTHKGEHRGIAPTGKQVSWRSTVFYRVAGGKTAEVWVIGEDVTPQLK